MSIPWRRLTPLLAAGLLAFGLMGIALGPAEAQRRRDMPGNGIDPAALAALARMGDHVGSLQGFEFNSAMEFDVVAGNGQTVTVVGTGRYVAKRPDRLRVDLTNSLFTKQYIYDGKTLTIVSPTEGFYGTLPAKSNIRDTLADLAKGFGIELPLSDLFELGAPDNEVGKRIRSAFIVGDATINGQETEHLAFRTGSRDWELWIRKGDKPVPLKVVMIARADPAAPRFNATLTWVDPPASDEGLFTFAPKEDLKRIDFLQATAKREGR